MLRNFWEVSRFVQSINDAKIGNIPKSPKLFCEISQKFFAGILSGEKKSIAMDKNIHERVQRMIDEICGGNKSEFTRRIGRPVTAVKDIIGGKHTAPSYDLIYSILSSDLGISPRWLILGEGDMLETEIAKPLIPANDINNSVVIIGNWDGLAPIVETAVNKVLQCHNKN